MPNLEQQFCHDVHVLLDVIEHIMQDHQPSGPCFDQLKEKAAKAQRSLVMYQTRN